MLLLLDHDNVLPNQDTLLNILRLWITHLTQTNTLPLIKDILLRIYGGWYEDEYASDHRYIASALYQEICPTFLTHDKGTFRIKLEFADSLLAVGADPRDSRIEIRYTTALRRSPKYVSIRKSAKCEEDGCRLQDIKKWIRKGTACTMGGCKHGFQDIFYRKEQKQVDIHMAVDLLHAISDKSSHTHIAIASSDFDFLPALAYAVVQKVSGKTITQVRSSKSKSTYIDDFLNSNNLNIIEF